MCSPVAVGMGAIGGMSAMQDAQIANEQANAQNRASEISNQRAFESAYLEQRASITETQQEMDMIARKDFEAQRELMRTQGAVVARGAERGSTGNTMDRVYDTSTFNHLLDIEALNTQADQTMDKYAIEGQAIRQRYEGNLQTNSAKGQGSLTTGLNLLTGGASGAVTGMSLDNSYDNWKSKQKTSAPASKGTV